MAEIRINATGGVKLYDADDSHYAQIIAGTITANVDLLTLNSAGITVLDGAIDFDIASHDTSNGLKLGGTLVTATAAELNIMDGVGATASEINLIDGSAKSTSSITVVDADAFIVIDGTTTKQIPASDIKTYAGTTINNATANELTTIGSTTTELDAEANLTFTGSALTCIGTITTGVDDTGHDVKFFGATASAYMLWDESADQLQLPGSTIQVGGAPTAGTPDIHITSNPGVFSIRGTSGSVASGSPLIFLDTLSSGVGKILIDGGGFAMHAGNLDSVGAAIFELANNGDLTIAGSLTESSDYRLKENETAITDGITRIKQLKPYRFNFKTDTDTTLDGFFAHEVESVVPEAVLGTKDGMKPEMLYTEDFLYDERDARSEKIPEGKSIGDIKYRTGDVELETEIDPQKLCLYRLVPLLTSALQEAITKIETLEAKVTALEG